MRMHSAWNKEQVSTHRSSGRSAAGPLPRSQRQSRSSGLLGSMASPTQHVSRLAMCRTPRYSPSVCPLNLQDERGVSRDEMAAALVEIGEGRIPNDRIALKCLHDEMVGWPFLEVRQRALEGVCCTGCAVRALHGTVRRLPCTALTMLGEAHNPAAAACLVGTRGSRMGCLHTPRRTAQARSTALDDVTNICSASPLNRGRTFPLPLPSLPRSVWTCPPPRGQPQRQARPLLPRPRPPRPCPARQTMRPSWAVSEGQEQRKVWTV
jgi:hypothetical protein